MSSGDIMGLTDDYMAAMRARHAARMANATPISHQTSYYETNKSSPSIDVRNNTREDEYDGKIGLDGVLLSLGKGIVKGAINGIKGMFTDSEGKFSIGKTLLSVGVAALCIAFPAAGAVACGIGAIAGGTQVLKGFSVALNTDGKSDAEVKAAWENIGEGGSTVIGCALGAKASIGAMKGSSLAALDDVLKSTDELASIAGKTDDVAKALKGVNLNNADDIAHALTNAKIDGLSNVDDIAKTAKTLASKDMSALGSLKNLDEMTGMEKVTRTLKAAGKDAVSSSKNNAAKAWRAATQKVSAKAEKAKVNKDLKEAEAKFEKAKQKEADYEELDFYDEKVSELSSKKAKMDEADGTTAKIKKKEAKSAAADDVKSAKAKLDEATKVANQKAKADKLKGKTKTDFVQEQTQIQRDTLAAAKKTKKKADFDASPLGEAKAKAAEVLRNNGGEGVIDAHKDTMHALADLRNGDKGVLATLKSDATARNHVLNSLGKEGKVIFNYLFKEGATVDDAIAQYGWHQVTQVVRTMYALGQANQVV